MKLLFAWQTIQAFIGLLPKRKNVWGTVYDAHTKRPIAFANVQLIDEHRRVLETRIADAEGRYGFLITPQSLATQGVRVQIVVSAPSYSFPSRATPTVDSVIYSNLYFGALLLSNDTLLLNYDIPMDPLIKSPSISLGISAALIADIGFWLGLVLVPLNAILAPSPFSIGILVLFLGAAILRIWVTREHPFGIVSDVHTGMPMPYALITLNDTTGRRVAFTVADERGRYFLLAQKGTYELKAFTPAAIQPSRTSTTTITARTGWIPRALTV